jgi:hypothetical protein
VKAFYILGKQPCYFYHFYAMVLFFLLSIRYFAYKSKNMHYFLFEFCYYANVGLVTTVYLFP